LKRPLTAIIFATFVIATIGPMAGCEKTQETVYLSKDKLTPGIFLEPEERGVLPPGVEIRKVYHKAIDLAKESEGFIGKPYNDAASYCTIGYGHLIHLAPCDASIPEDFKKGISETRGTEILQNDMGRAELGIMTLVDVELTDGQYGALCDFVFNVGVGNFRDSSLRKRVNAGDHSSVPFEFRRWVLAAGKKLPGLEARREKEIALYFEGMGIPRAVPRLDQDQTLLDIRTGKPGS
jgi:lysozyme